MQSWKNYPLITTLLENPEDFVKSYFKDKDGQPLILTDYQIDYVRGVLSREKKKFIFIAPTQAGKSETVSVTLCLICLFFPRERIVNISYTDEQAKIIFERVKAHLVEDSEIIRSFVDLNRTLEGRKEFSKKRMFLKNGSEIRVFSTGTGETEMSAESLLGFEATVLSLDESGSVPDDIYNEKLIRMLGAERSIGLPKLLLESGTPHRRNHFYRSFNSLDYYKVHVDWRKALKAGRFNQEFIDNRREELTRQQFDIWYEAIFPTTSDDGMFDEAEIDRNIIPEERGFIGEKILGVDVARYGEDKCVFTVMDRADNDMWFMRKVYALEHKSTMETAGFIQALHREIVFDRIFIDDIGVGGGVTDRLKEMQVSCNGIVGGSRPEDQELYTNLKAELYQKAKKLLEENKLKVLDNQYLRRDFMAIKKSYDSAGGKLRIIKPSKSPDYLDSLIFCLKASSSPGKAGGMVMSVKW